MAIPATITEFLQTLPIPWLVGGPNGRADVTAQGTVYDEQVDLLKEAAQARYPSQAPDDALEPLGGDRQLIRGTSESDADFRVRLANAWTQHSLRGTWVELLTQMYWSCGIQPGGAYIIQQNGLAYSLASAPLADDDATAACARLDITIAATDYHSFYPTPVPFYLLGAERELCRRFAIIFPSPWLGPFRTTVVAEFDGTTDRVRVNWPTDIPGSYTELVGLPSVVSGGPVTITTDATTRTPGGIDVIASAAFVGSVLIVAVPAGANPFANMLPSALNTLRTIVKRWKPAKAECMWLTILASPVNVWGWPLTRKWGDPGLVWGAPNNSVTYSPEGV